MREIVSHDQDPDHVADEVQDVADRDIDEDDLLGLSADRMQISHKHHQKDNDAHHIRLYVEKSIIHLHVAIIA